MIVLKKFPEIQDEDLKTKRKILAEPFKEMFAFLNKLNEEAVKKLETTQRKMGDYYTFLTIATNDKYEKQNMAKKLCLHQMNHLVENGCKGICVECTSPKSTHLFFTYFKDCENVAEIVFKDFEFEGQRPFLNLEGKGVLALVSFDG